MASENCRVTVKRLRCGDDLPNQASPAYEPFSVCLPLGRVLRYDGTGFTLEGTVATPDGVYGLFTVENGCITGAQEQPACEYTAQPCTPAAAPCGNGGSGSVTLQPGADNLLNFDSSGRLGARLLAEGGSGINVSGTGTVSDPLKITLDTVEQDGTAIRAADQTVTVEGTGAAADPYFIGHAASGVTPGTYNGITVDERGHVTAAEETTGAITDVQGSPGIEVQSAGTTRTLSLAAQSEVSGTYTLGGYNVTCNTYGIVTRVAEAIRLADTSTIQIDPTQYLFTLSRGGSVAALTPNPQAARDNFCEIFTPARADTSITFTSVAEGYFRIHYTGLLPVANGAAVNGYIMLTAPYRVLVNGRTITAYARRSVANNYTEVIALTDGKYSAGEHTVTIACSTTDFSFSDTSFLTVTLVQRP